MGVGWGRPVPCRVVPRGGHAERGGFRVGGEGVRDVNRWLAGKVWPKCGVVGSDSRGGRCGVVE
eukprot:9662022-Prorocentrum_lima.AAC.1